MHHVDSQDKGSDLHEEFDRALKNQNYIRAARIAQLQNRPEEEIRGLQEKALKQFIVEYRNAQGVQTLIKEYRFSHAEVERLVQSILEDIRNEETGKTAAKSQFDIETMRFLKLDEWIERYVRPRR